MFWVTILYKYHDLIQIRAELNTIRWWESELNLYSPVLQVVTESQNAHLVYQVESTRPVVVQDRFERPEENKQTANCTYRVEAEQWRQSDIQKKGKNDIVRRILLKYDICIDYL